MTHDRRRSEEQPGTALDEVLSEAEEAGRRTTGSGRRRYRGGEAGDGITPSADAQEQSSGDDD